MYVILYRDGPRGKWCAIVSLQPTRVAANLWCEAHPVKGRAFKVAYIDIA